MKFHFEANKLKLFLLFLIILVNLIHVTNGQTSCYTPQSLYGRCVPFHQCTWVLEVLDRYGSNLPNDQRDILVRSKCVGSTQETHVCCQASLIKKAAPVTEVRTTDTNEVNQRGLDILRAQECGFSNPNRVAFGEEADPGEYPWMALLKYDTPSQPFLCGGSLITTRYVLSAAHCTVGKRAQIIGVVLGEHDTTTDIDCKRKGRVKICTGPAVEYGIEKIIPHRGYHRESLKNDIMLIRLNREVELKVFIEPICLPITDATKVFPAEYFIAGWGTTETGSTSNTLQRAKVEHKDISYCRDIFRDSPITENHICAAGQQRIESCTGDSGGPLFFISPYETTARFVQFGLVASGAKGCGDASYPGIYTNIRQMIPWITNNIE